MRPKVTFVTRHYAPSANINGESVRDMAKYLSDHFQIESNVICIDKIEDHGGANTEPVGHVIRLKTIYKGSKAFFRFFTFLYDGWILTRQALKYKDTLIICTTSPPLLPFWASLLFGKKIKWGLWTLDLFPEGFHATHMISDKNPLYQWVLKKTYTRHPNFLIALGEQQSAHVQAKYGQPIPTEILPCGVPFFQEISQTKPHWWTQDKVTLGYCGNINDAHNPDFITAVIDALEPKRYQLVLALYGKHANAIKAYAKDKNKKGVVLVDRVDRNQLHFIDIHLVTLRQSWTHIAVPSKAVSAISMGGALLFCGDQSSDNWNMFEEAGWFINEQSDLSSQVADFFRNFSTEELKRKQHQARKELHMLQQLVLNTYSNIAQKIIDQQAL